MRIALMPLIIVTLVAASSLAPAYAADGYTISQDHIYGHKAGMALTFDAVTPANPNGIGLLLMVSGGWVSIYFDLDKAMSDSERQGGRFTVLLDRGFTLFMVRHGSSPYFKVPDAVADVRRAVRYIRLNAAEFGVDPDRLGVFGASAGGHLSLMLGTTTEEGNADSEDPVDRTAAKVAAVVAYFPPVDLTNIVGPSDRFPALNFDPAEAESVSPIFHVSSDDAPTLLVHGDEDTLVPLNNSERIFEAFEKAKVPTRLIVMEGAQHGFRGKHSREAASALADWFERYLIQHDTD